jgi:hypothetical protein
MKDLVEATKSSSILMVSFAEVSKNWMLYCLAKLKKSYQAPDLAQHL